MWGLDRVSVGIVTFEGECALRRYDEDYSLNARSLQVALGTVFEVGYNVHLRPLDFPRARESSYDSRDHVLLCQPSPLGFDVSWPNTTRWVSLTSQTGYPHMTGHLSGQLSHRSSQEDTHTLS